MARTTVDFSDVQEFSAIPKGDYPAVIVKAEYRGTETTGKEHPYINWEFDLTDGEFKGRKQWLVTSFSPKALWRLKDMMENLGVVEEEIEFDYDEETGLITDPELVGLPCVLSVSKGMYQGRETNNVDAVTAPEGGAPKKTSRGGRKPAARKPAGTKGRTFK